MYSGILDAFLSHDSKKDMFFWPDHLSGVVGLIAVYDRKRRLKSATNNGTESGWTTRCTGASQILHKKSHVDTTQKKGRGSLCGRRLRRKHNIPFDKREKKRRNVKGANTTTWTPLKQKKKIRK